MRNWIPITVAAALLGIMAVGLWRQTQVVARDNALMAIVAGR